VLQAGIRSSSIPVERVAALTETFNSLLPAEQPPLQGCGWFAAFPFTEVQLGSGHECRSVMLSSAVGLLGSDAEAERFLALASAIDDACNSAQWVGSP
jgi:hypothetical protein